MSTVYRVIYRQPFPSWRDFRYAPAAHHWRDLVAAVDPTATVVTLGEEA